MTIASFTSNPQNYSITNIDMEDKKEKLVNREVLCNVSYLVTELMSQEKYFEELSKLFGQGDDEENLPEVFEYWAVTSWFAEKLKAQGELVSEFFDLVIWGRQTTGQLICMDAVIDDITRELFAKDSAIDFQNCRSAITDPYKWARDLLVWERLHNELMTTTDPQRYQQIKQQIQNKVDADGDHD
jgi:hypothetical protein